MIKRYIFKALLIALLVTQHFAVMAQDSPEMADTMRSNGKIYVVVVVMSVLFIGLIAYLFNTDKKISQLEKEVEILKQTKN